MCMQWVWTQSNYEPEPIVTAMSLRWVLDQCVLSWSEPNVFAVDLSSADCDEFEYNVSVEDLR